MTHYHTSKSKSFAVRLLYRLRPSENALLLTLAVMLGLATAGGLWLFRLGIEFFQAVFVDGLGADVLGDWGEPGIVIALGIAGLAVGWVRRFTESEPYHGMVTILERVALSGGRLNYRRMPLKSVVAAMSLGAGSSVGPEDPSVIIGANLGSMFGQRLHLSEEQIRLLVSAGAASAISAAFNAPIAGVFFALEVILNGELTTSSVGIVIVAAVFSTGITQALQLDQAAMGPFDFTLQSVLEVPFYIPLAVLLAPLAAGFIKITYWLYDTLRNIRLPGMVKTGLAGVLVGVVGIYLPEIRVPGNEAMNDVLSGAIDHSLVMLAALALGKLLMTAISLASGFVGGIFAPSLFIGTMFGKLYGNMIVAIVGPFAGDPRAYAVAGMAGMMAGVVRAPITAIMLVFELTNDYRFILPIMLVSVICIWIAERMTKHGMYEEGLVRQGYNIQSGRDVDLMQGITVRESMVSPAPAINQKATLTELRDKLRAHHRHALCVVDDEGQLVGIVTLSDLQRAYNDNGTCDVTVGSICTQDVLVAHPDDMLWQAIRNMGARNVGRLPVVDERTGALVGLVNRHDIVDAYNTAIQRKLKEQQLQEQIRLNTLTGAHVYELHIRRGSLLDGQHIKEVKWPPESIVASIQRKGKLIVPHGHTQLRSGDVLMVVADPHAEIQLMRLFGHERASL